jgi:hypothetical protein
MTTFAFPAMRRWLLAVLALSFFMSPLAARAADYSAGATLSGTNATLWMKSSVGSTWVDAHYNVDGGAQQNVRMTRNSASGQFETIFPASAGQTVSYQFTYNIGSAAHDSPWGSSVLAGTNQAATPVFAPAPGTYASAQTVTLSTATPATSIYYTTDGSTPSTSSSRYTAALSVANTTTLKAIATASGMAPSNVSVGTFTINTDGGGGTTGYSQGVDVAGQTATIWFSAPSGTSWVDVHFNAGSGQQNVRMSPNSTTGRFEQALAAAPGTTITYSFTWFTTAATDTPPFTYTVGNGSGTIASPSISPAGGSFNAAQTVQITDFTAGATIHYTLDGSMPTASSPSYVGALQVASTTTVKAIATLSGSANSAVASATFTISAPTVAAPAFSPAGGFFPSTQTVTIQDATPGAILYYTTDGSTPGTSSAQVDGPLTIASTKTLKVVGVKSGYVTSAVASATYTIAASPFVQGVTEMGSTATLWFKPTTTMNFVILHVAVSTGAQNNPQMAWNPNLTRWESIVSNLSAGNLIHYSFTYSPVSGPQQDSPAYMYTMGQGNGIPTPAFSPAGGSFITAQSVRISTTAANATIRYTLDGSAPNQLSTQYTGPLTIASATTINAITLLADGSQSAVAMSNYLIGSSGGTVSAPAFSQAGGSYATHVRLTMSSATGGATLHYTIDGSTPTAASPIYGGPLEISATTTVKAVAVKSGMSTSSITTATYTLTGNTVSTWNGKTTFNLVNATNGKWADNQVYWAIIGKDWATGKFVHVDATGNLVPMAVGDNGALTKNGQSYSNYFFTLAQMRSVTIPPINSARLLMSVGSPMYVWVNQDINGNIGYAGANIENPTDPNIDVTFDFGEFAILPPGNSPQGIFINTTRVDQFGFPVKLSVSGLDGFHMTVGEPLTETRDQLFAKFIGETPAAFSALAQAPYAPYRIVAPAHATFAGSGPQARYLDAYIASVWSQYANQDLVIDLHNGWAPFAGRVSGNVMHFTDANGGSYWINGVPTTEMVLLGDGLLNDPSGASDVGKQLQLQAQVCAALNRQVAQRAFGDWWNSAYFFPAGQPANSFAKFWHDHSIDALAYGFAYDDVGSYSPSIHTEVPTTVTYTIGW